MRTDTPLEAVLKRDRLLVLAGIIGVATLAWAYTVYVASSIGAAPGTAMAMPKMQSWSAAHWAAMFVMWMVMMIAMMVPSAAPMILMFATINRQRREKQQPYVPTGVFLLGYAVVWSGFAAGATIGNWGLHTHAMLSSMMGSSTNALLGGVLLVAAGAFQWTRLKYVCLTIRRTCPLIHIQNALLLAVPALNQLSHNFLLESHKVYCRLLQSTANIGTFLGKPHEQLVD